MSKTQYYITNFIRSILIESNVYLITTTITSVDIKTSPNQHADNLQT